MGVKVRLQPRTQRHNVAESSVGAQPKAYLLVSKVGVNP